MDNLFLIQNKIVCLKFDKYKYKIYNKYIKKKLYTFLLIMAKIDKIPPEICDFILKFIELDKLK